MAKKKEERLHLQLRMPRELKRDIQAYAQRRSTNLSELVTRFFYNLLEAERLKKEVDAEQI